MRSKPLLGLLILGFAALIVVPAITSGQFQPGGGGFGKKGRGGPGGGGGMDANSMFDRYAKGQPFVLISSLKKGQEVALQYAKEKGITNGQLNRAQFIEFQEQLNAKVAAFFGGNKGPGNPGGGFNFKKPNPDAGGQPNPGGGAPNPAANPDFINTLADAEFKQYDTNSDGKLNLDEMPGRLKNNLAKWDKNKDELIDLFEFRDYFRDSLANRFNGGGRGGPAIDANNRNIASIIIDDDELDRKTVVYRAGPGGKMPDGLPKWFVDLDTDGDGQVALYEWRRGGKNLDEFKNWDLNDDGYITPEEAVKVQTAFGKTAANASADKGNRPAFDPTKAGKGKGKIRGTGN